MTVEERLARLETTVEGQKEWLGSIDGKVDQLIAVSNMGKGALVLLLKIGGGATLVVSAIVYVLEKFHLIR